MFDLNRLLNVMSFQPDAPADFQRMLDWKLLRGSHEFPGPDGGTCINEAAIVAAGYPYRAVYCVKDMPAGFSRPIAMLALCLTCVLRLHGAEALTPIDLSKPHPFIEAGNREFNMFLWMPPHGQRGGDILLADSTIFTTLFGGDESLERFWKNLARK